jgi:hypothetical protein
MSSLNPLDDIAKDFVDAYDDVREAVRRKRGQENDERHRAEYPYGCASGGKCLICLPIALPPMTKEKM